MSSSFVWLVQSKFAMQLVLYAYNVILALFLLAFRGMIRDLVFFLQANKKGEKKA